MSPPGDDPALEQAARRALKLLRIKDRSREELRARLLAAGYHEPTIEGVLARLARFIDDERIARALAERAVGAQALGARALRERLERRGFAPDAIEHAVQLARAREPHAVLEAARALLARQDPTLPRPVRWRRLAQALGRRGFGEDACRDAATHLLGEPGAN